VSPLAEFAVGAVIVVGLLGIVVPVLPGALLIWVAVLVWSSEAQTSTGWLVLAVASVCIVGSQVAKWAVPQRRLRLAGVPRRSMMYGGLLGLVGFFVIPVAGLVIGFLAGVYLAERRRVGDHDRARASTLAAFRVAGLSVLIELLGGLLAALVWGAAALST
jgi:uncharacterized protein YqgC (DUF456 family)